MTEKRFWEIVRKINWSRYWKFEKNCDICRQRMLRACTQDELKNAEKTITKLLAMESSTLCVQKDLRPMATLVIIP